MWSQDKGQLKWPESKRVLYWLRDSTVCDVCMWWCGQIFLCALKIKGKVAGKQTCPFECMWWCGQMFLCLMCSQVHRLRQVKRRHVDRR